MLFNSIEYILFLPLVVALYWGLTAYGRRRLILLSSYVFYWTWSVPFSGLLALSTVIDYYSALYISRHQDKKKRKLGLLFSLICNLGILCTFKYLDFFSDVTYSIFGEPLWPKLYLALPLGISFYTLQTMSYTIDVYRGTTKAKESILDVALYVSFFPQLIAGPIVRSNELIHQLDCKKDPRPCEARNGLGLIMWGLLKKVYIADPMAYVVNEVFGMHGEYSSFSILLATYAFGVQIYCDFSAYSDIAIGSAKLLGIKLPMNFNKPLLAHSVREFWKRWHLTLSAWLRDYVYVPLGGNKKGEFRAYANIMTTMLIGGLWHGAAMNWVVWGGLHGTLISVERFFNVNTDQSQSPLYKRLFMWICTFHFLSLSWFLVKGNNLAHAYALLKRLLEFDTSGLSIGFAPLYVLTLLLLTEKLRVKTLFLGWFEEKKSGRWLAYGIYVLFVLTFCKSSSPEFFYFQF